MSVESIRESLDGPTEHVCELLEKQWHQSASPDDMQAVLDLFPTSGPLSGYRSVCLVLMAQLADGNGDKAAARQLLNRANPLKLEQFPPVYLVKCFLLKAAAADPSDLTQKDRMLTKGIDQLEKHRDSISPDQHTMLQFRLRRERCMVLLKAKKLEACLNEALKVFESGFKSDPELFDSHPEFIENLHTLTQLLLYLPYGAAKVCGLQRFAAAKADDPALARWADERLNGGVRQLLAKLNSGVIVRLDNSDGLLNFLKGTFREDDHYEQVCKNIVEMDLVAISYKFSRVTLATAGRLIGEDQEQILDVIVPLALNRKIDASIDEVTGVITFKQDKPEWNKKVVQVFTETDTLAREAKRLTTT